MVVGLFDVDRLAPHGQIELAGAHQHRIAPRFDIESLAIHPPQPAIVGIDF